MGSRGRGLKKFSDWERVCRNLSEGRPGEEEEEESFVSQFSSFSSELSPTACLARIFLLTVAGLFLLLNCSSCTLLEQISQGLLMGGLKLLLLLGEDQAAAPGSSFCVHATTKVLGAGQPCQVEGEVKALEQENILSAVPDSCLLCLWDGFAGQGSDLLCFVGTKRGIIWYL